MLVAPSILLIRRRYLGDIVLLGSVLRNLKLHWPEAHIAVLCEAAYAGVLTMNPDVDRVFTFPQSSTDWWRTAWRLRQARFTHVLDLDNRDKTAFLARLSGAPVRVTLRHGARLHFPFLYTRSGLVSPDFFEQHHITDLYLECLDYLDVPTATHECRLTPQPEDVTFVRALLAPLPPASPTAPRLLIHPGSRSAWRVWPPENFARVIDQLHERHGVSVALVAGPGEQSTVDEITRHLRTPVLRLDQQLTVPQLGALFAEFGTLLCHDSGPMHLAAAVGTRVVALFGSQPMHVWRPLGAGHITLQPPLPCVNCASPGQCQPHDSYRNHCVRLITPAQVLTALSTTLQLRPEPLVI